MSAPSTLGSQLLAAEFPHRVLSPRLIETHISWVVLTGKYAYKVKKPVHFDFLDYSTLEMRRRQCERECEIGRSYAPEIYLDVVSIRARDGRLLVGISGGQVIDYAVRMKEFDQDQLLDRQLAAGRVRTEEMDALATQVAHYHAQAARVDLPPTLAVERAIEPVGDNFRYLRRHLSASAYRGEIRELERWTDDEIAALRPWFAERAAGGRIRECHGDLHLGNLLRVDHPPFFLAFDPIEFNARLSQIDTINEVAFLMMELHEHGYPAHARRWINQYLESTDDYAGVRGLRYYLIYRALVRAKVDLIRRTQTIGRQQTSFSQEGWRYVRYARQVAVAQPPTLWLTHGFSGSGKSTRAMRLVEERGLFRIRSDVIRKRALGIDTLAKTPDSRLEEAYSRELTERVYERMAQACEQVLQAGSSPIADAAFLQRAQRQKFRELADRLGVRWKIIACAAPRDELERRLAQRGPDPSDATQAVLARQVDAAEPLDELEQSAIAGETD
jgi:hypothetical protein